MSYIKLASERLSEFVKYGNSRQQKVSRGTFYIEKLKDPSFQPVFVLSTGRAGTTLTTQIFEDDKSVFVIHDHPQDLLFVSRLAYEAYQQDISQGVNKMAGAAYLAAREAELYSSFLHNKLFIETNNRITFLAPGIKHLIPHAKFVLLYRHPGDFVRSGMRRGYYQNDNYTEQGRIRPVNDSEWNELSAEEKIAWLWNETNGFAYNFLQTLPESDRLIMEFPYKDPSQVEAMLKFCSVANPGDSRMKQLLQKPVNQQVQGDYPKYKEWDEELLNKVKAITAELDQKLNIIW